MNRMRSGARPLLLPIHKKMHERASEQRLTVAFIDQRSTLNQLKSLLTGSPIADGRLGTKCGSSESIRDPNHWLRCRGGSTFDDSCYPRPAGLFHGRHPAGQKTKPLRLSAFITFFGELCSHLQQWQPDAVAVEEVFYSVNANSALKLGHVREWRCSPPPANPSPSLNTHRSPSNPVS